MAAQEPPDARRRGGGEVTAADVLRLQQRGDLGSGPARDDRQLGLGQSFERLVCFVVRFRMLLRSRVERIR